MRKRILALVVLSLGLLSFIVTPVSSQHGFGDDSEPMFFCPIKNLAGRLPQGLHKSLFFSGSGFRLSAF
ncbi:hypothetical protein O2313_04245 [Bacillus amyloliquefaciens]|nr:hypothetical protein [Bacillus amyloliquefaciens]MCZ4246739.1 hypothetical protein [Bacillus amyloliquefaciens]